MRAAKRERERAQRIRVLQSIGLAVLVHLAIVPFLAVFIPDPPPAPERKTIRMVSLMSKGSILPRPQPKLDYE